MTDKERKILTDRAAKISQSVKSNPDLAIEILKEIGILTPTGRVSKHYSKKSIYR